MKNQSVLEKIIGLYNFWLFKIMLRSKPSLLGAENVAKIFSIGLLNFYFFIKTIFFLLINGCWYLLSKQLSVQYLSFKCLFYGLPILPPATAQGACHLDAEHHSSIMKNY